MGKKRISAKKALSCAINVKKARAAQYAKDGCLFGGKAPNQQHLKPPPQVVADKFARLADFREAV